MANIEKQWFAIATYSSHENKVKDNLLARVESMKLQDYVFRIIVAEHEVPVMRNGQPTGKTKMPDATPRILPTMHVIALNIKYFIAILILPKPSVA